MPQVLGRALEQRLKGAMEMKDTVFSYTKTDKPGPTRELLCNVPKFYVYMTTCMFTTVQGVISRTALTPQNMQKPYKTSKYLKTKQKHSFKLTWGAGWFLNNLFHNKKRRPNHSYLTVLHNNLG